MIRAPQGSRDEPRHVLAPLTILHKHLVSREVSNPIPPMVKFIGVEGGGGNMNNKSFLLSPF